MALSDSALRRDDRPKARVLKLDPGAFSDTLYYNGHVAGYVVRDGKGAKLASATTAYQAWLMAERALQPNYGIPPEDGV